MSDSNRKILIERFRNNDKPLNYIKESGTNEKGKHYIGRLEGVAADFFNPTRNGRKYVLRLWKNVQESEDFKEGMDTLTIFGEADHPEDRLETSIKEVAVCLRKFEIRETEGVVWCSFDILDTPNGRIIKELLDYGSKLGVSSRGSGEEIIENGEVIIDPDTYVFICFDVVIMPAVASARPKRVESKQVDVKATSLIESIKREINQATTIQELNSIKSIVESQNIPGIDSIKESLDTKLSKLRIGDDVSSKFVAELESLTERMENLISENTDLKSRLSASEARLSNYKDLISKMKSNSKSMRLSIRENHAMIRSLQDSIIENVEQYKDYQSKLDSLISENRIIKRSNRRLQERNRSLSNDISAVKTESRKMISERESDNESISLLESKVRSLENELILSKRDSESKLSELSKQSSSIKKKYEDTLSSNREVLVRYAESQATLSGLSSDLVISNLHGNYNIKNIDRVIKSLVEKRDRINKVPIDLTNKISIFRESPMDDEQRQTIEILEGVNKSNKITN